jgi:hypothetical protein
MFFKFFLHQLYCCDDKRCVGKFCASVSYLTACLSVVFLFSKMLVFFGFLFFFQEKASHVHNLFQNWKDVMTT